MAIEEIPQREPLLSGKGVRINGGSDNYGTINAGRDDLTEEAILVQNLHSSNEISRNNKKALYSILYMMLFESILANADASFVLTTAGAISSEFGKFEDSSWIVLSYSLTMGASQPLYGKLCNIYGRQKLLVFSYIIFPLGCFLSGTATNIWQVILGRAISGIGGGGMGAVAAIILNDLLPTHEMAIWRGYLNVGATTGRGIGGPLGGWITDLLGWRWSFIGQVPLAFIGVFMAMFNQSLKDLNKKHESQTVSLEIDVPQINSSKLARIDFAGAFTLVSSIIIFILLLSLGGITFSWYSLQTSILMISGLIMLGMFVYIELKVANEPIFPLELFRYKNVWLSYLISTFQTGAQASLMYMVPLYFQLTADDSNSAAGARLIPAVLGSAFGGIFSGAYIKKNGRYKLMCIIAGLVAAVTYLTLSLRWEGNTNFWESLEIFPGGFGTGVALTGTFVALSHGLSTEDTAIAISGLYLTTSLGLIGGFAAVGAIIQQSLQRILRHDITTPDAPEIIQKAISDVNYVRSLTGTLKETVIHAYVVGMRNTHIFSLILSILTFIAALGLHQMNIFEPSSTI